MKEKKMTCRECPVVLEAPEVDGDWLRCPFDGALVNPHYICDQNVVAVNPKGEK